MSSDLLARALEDRRICRATPVGAADLVQSIPKTGARLVVLGADLRTEHGDGFSLAELIGRLHPEVFVVLLLPRCSREGVINGFRVGARGIFPRERPIADFIDCVDRVRRGFLWVGGQEADFLRQAFRSIPAPNVLTALNAPALTDRELQVVQQAATGKTNRMIARELFLSEHTVKNYLFRAFEKLGVSSRIELLFYLMLSGHMTTLPEGTPADGDSAALGKASGE
jgi:two-component system nitrate/nitrite response regulator NarL